MNDFKILLDQLTHLTEDDRKTALSIYELADEKTRQEMVEFFTKQKQDLIGIYDKFNKKVLDVLEKKQQQD